MRLVGLVACGVTLLAHLPEAAGCSGPTCFPGILPAEGSIVPANSAALLWDPMFAKSSGLPVPTTTTARLWDRTLDVAVPFRLEPSARGLLVRPEAALVPGRTYALEAQDCFHSQHLLSPVALDQTTFTATVTRPFPTAIGTLRILRTAVEELWVPFTIFECSADQPARFQAAIAEVELSYSDDALPFEPLFFLQLRVDGRLVAQLRNGAFVQVDQRLGKGHRAPRGRDVVILPCIDGSERQTFSVTMEAELPGVAVFETPPIEVALDCDQSDGGSVELPHDAGTSDAAAIDELVEDAGCGCRASREGDGLGAWWAILGWSCLLRRRRTV